MLKNGKTAQQIVNENGLRQISDAGLILSLIDKVLADNPKELTAYLNGKKHVCFPGLPGMKERTILIGGFSKNYAMTGWRVGFAAAPAPLLQGLLRIHQYTIRSAPTMAQFAALEAMKAGEQHVQDMANEYDRRRKLIVKGLNALGLKTCEPNGAFYAFPNVTISGLDEETFAERLLHEEKVAVVPGSAFGAGGAGFVRCSYATSHESPGRHGLSYYHPCGSESENGIHA